MKNKIIQVVKRPRLILLFALGRMSRCIKSDKCYYKLQYYCFTGHVLDIDHPTTYVEKMQWLKVHDRNPLYTIMADKFAAKEYVAGIIGGQYIVPTIGVWDRPEDINWSRLPDKFVLKATHGGGGLDVVICNDKKGLDIKAVCKKLNKSLSSDFWRMREYQYKDIPRKIIAEQYLEDYSGGLIDYKVMCFDGEPKLIQVHKNRFTNQTQDIYDIEWNRLDVYQRGYPNSNENVERPNCLDEMLSCCRKLSQGIPQVRIDWYVVGDSLYFGELTLTDGGGFADWVPAEWDKTVSSWIKLPLQ